MRHNRIDTELNSVNMAVPIEKFPYVEFLS